MGTDTEAEQDEGVHVKIPAEMLRRLDAAARTTHRSRSGAIRHAISEWLERESSGSQR